MVAMRICGAFLATLTLSVSTFAYSQTNESAARNVLDDPGSVPMAQVYQGIFVTLFPATATLLARPLPDTTRESVVAFFKNGIGLDDEGSEALFNYVRDGITEQNDRARMELNQLCERSAEIESKTQLADGLLAIMDEGKRTREQLWGADLFEILDDENGKALSDYAMKRRATMRLVTQTDPHAAFAASPETLDQILERVCRT